MLSHGGSGLFQVRNWSNQQQDGWQSGKTDTLKNSI